MGDVIDLRRMIRNAKEAALRDGYDQIVYMDKNGGFGIARKYPGCLAEWNCNTELYRISLIWENGVKKTKVFQIGNE